MELRTIASTWYEAVMIGGYSCKLSGTYNSKREAQKAIKESNTRATERDIKQITILS